MPKLSVENLKFKHTPTPWKFSNGQLVSQDGFVIAEKNDDGSADAAFIVRAVNSHEEMLRALKEAKNMLLDLGHKESFICKQAVAVIAKAEGK